MTEHGDWHTKSAAETLSALNTSERGLSEEEAAERLARFGKNALGERKKKSLWMLILGQFKDIMVIVLLAAAALSLAFGDWAEAVVIFVIVLLDAVIGVVEERKAESALEALKELGAPNARVIRGGEEKLIPAEQLVPGDIVVLEDGCIVPADLRLLKESDLRVQESALTGESVPVEKDATKQFPSDAPLGDRENMAYSSTIVTYGAATGVVVGTGMNTEVGKIAGLVGGEEPLTPLQKKLNGVGRWLSITGLAIALVMVAIGLIYDIHEWRTVLLTAIALAVSVIPEGLPATATIVMALGVRRMAKEQALVRSLPAVETLGSATVVCCDKTGTLTLNRMTVVCCAAAEEIAKGEPLSLKGEVSSERERLMPLVRAAALCNDAALGADGECLGDPTEGALLTFANLFGAPREELEKTLPRRFEQPFDSDRKRMSTVNGEELLISTKGAVDGLLPLCTRLLENGNEREMTEEDRVKILAFSETLSEQALRVLAFARGNATHVPEEGEDVEQGLCFLGLTGMIDPPRTSVISAVESCHSAGIRVVMITGDHKTTAVAIARQLKIFEEGNAVLTGAELNALSDEELDKIVSRTTVFARVSPSDKLRIMQSLQRNGEVAAMTGDGVNDSPALKAADIGVAMGAGTDVAKSASDVILLDNDFNTIESAVKEGRRVYRNIQKVIQFLLSGNLAEVLVHLVAAVFHWVEPLLAVHILLINLVTDTLPGLALGVDPADKNVMKRPPVKSGTLFERGMIVRIVLFGLLITATSLTAYHIGLQTSAEAAMTACFFVISLSQLVHALNQRSDTDSVFARGNGHNPMLFAAILGSAAIVAAVLFIPPVQAFFSLTFLKPAEYLILLALSFAPLVFSEAIKLCLAIARRIRKRA